LLRIAVSVLFGGREAAVAMAERICWQALPAGVGAEWAALGEGGEEEVVFDVEEVLEEVWEEEVVVLASTRWATFTKAKEGIRLIFEEALLLALFEVAHDFVFLQACLMVTVFPAPGDPLM